MPERSDFFGMLAQEEMKAITKSRLDKRIIEKAIGETEMEEMIVSPCEGMLKKIQIHQEDDLQRCSTIFQIKKQMAVYMN